jgi:hypothetical protein
MPSWSDVHAAAPDLAKTVQARFEAHGLGSIPVMRADGSPRITGIEPLFTDEVWLGMMPQSRKALDLLRDPRLSLHSASIDKEVREGDARVSGLGIAVEDEATLAQARLDFERHTGQAPPPGPMHLFRIDVREVVLVRPGADHLAIESWTPARGLRRVERT